MEEYKKVIYDLVKELNNYTKLYDEGNPAISDKEWDKLYFKLARMEADTGVYFPDSPTQTINYDVVNELEKVEHNHKMLSLAKTKNWEEFLQYFGDKDVVGMVKLDGLTCSLRYENGKLVAAETRGNGTVGENILHNAKVIKNIPKKIPYTQELVIDGEIVCTKQNFENFKDNYANPRNFAAGSIRLLDAEECSKRGLKFVAWKIVSDIFDNFIDSLTFAESLGFSVVPWTSSFDWDAKDFLVERAKEDGYPIDGLVGRFTDLKYGASLGNTDHHFRDGYAFKFADDEYETRLVDIEWGLGRTGVLTPIAVFQPVDDGESVIEKASLHNVSVMNEILGLPYVDQKIRVAKMNCIIPQVVWGDRTTNDCEMLPLPKICPVCGGETEIKESDSGVKTLWCTNPQCSGKLVNIIEHYCSKKGLDIKGLSEATIEKLIDWGWVNSISDLYILKLKRNDWVLKPGFGQKSVDNILNAIEESKNCELASFIAALGIPLIGSTYAKVMCKQEIDWHNIREDIEGNFDFTAWEGFGYEMDSALKRFDYTEADFLANTVLNITNSLWTDPNNEPAEMPLKDMSICITGKLIKFKNRTDATKEIESLGGKVVSSVSKNTSVLINNDKNSASSKNVNAKKLDIPIMSEEEFWKTYVENYKNF